MQTSRLNCDIVRFLDNSHNRYQPNILMMHDDLHAFRSSLSCCLSLSLRGCCTLYALLSFITLLVTRQERLQISYVLLLILLLRILTFSQLLDQDAQESISPTSQVKMARRRRPAPKPAVQPKASIAHATHDEGGGDATYAAPVPHDGGGGDPTYAAPVSYDEGGGDHRDATYAAPEWMRVHDFPLLCPCCGFFCTHFYAWGSIGEDPVVNSNFN